MCSDPVRELVEEYALGTLDADDRAAIERHLATCPDCRRLLDESREAADKLAWALAAASPRRLPADLKTRLLAALETSQAAETPVEAPAASEPAAPPAPRPTVPVQHLVPQDDGPPDDAAQPDGGPPRNTGAQPLDTGARPDARPWTDQRAGVQPSGPLPNRLPRPWWRHPQFVAPLAAAILLLVFSLAWGIQLSVALAQERALRAEFANLVDQQEAVLEVVDSNQTVKHVLRPPGGITPTSPYGKLYTRSDLRHVVAMAARLSQPPAEQAYHLWLTSQGQTHLAGVLAVNAQGFGLLVFDADHAGPVYEAAQLTLQPEGSTAPSGAPILTWQGSTGG
jgi:hypothetical protein